jgi:hypothetical protein
MSMVLTDNERLMKQNTALLQKIETAYTQLMSTQRTVSTLHQECGSIQGENDKVAKTIEFERQRNESLKRLLQQAIAEEQ